MDITNSDLAYEFYMTDEEQNEQIQALLREEE